jgi:hypothetical protein
VSVRLAVMFLALATAASAATPTLTEPQVRAFVERQSHLWNTGDLAAYFATFTPAATFTDQALANNNKIVPYGVSTVAQARAQATRALAKSKATEQTTITAAVIAPDGASARITAHELTTITGAGSVRRVCAQRVVQVAQTPKGPRATAQTDTIVRCR